MQRHLALMSSLLFALLMIACGSGNNTVTNSNQPTAAQPSPSSPTPTSNAPAPTPTGGTTPGGSSGGGGQQAPQTLVEALLSTTGGGGDAEVNPSLANGQNTQLAGTYWLTLAGGYFTGMSITARFCPFAVQGCTTLTDKPTFRNSGGMQIAGTFPGHGAYSGEFVITVNGVDRWTTGFTAVDAYTVFNGPTFPALLLRASTLASGLGAQAKFGIGTDPLSSGSMRVTYPGKTVDLTLAGASPSTHYTVSYCDPTGASCVALGTLTTDGSGDGAASLSIVPAQRAGDVNAGQFKLSRDGASGPIEFVSGFLVP